MMAYITKSNIDCVVSMQQVYIAMMQAILAIYTVLSIHTVYAKLVITNTSADRLVFTNYADYLGFTLRYL